MTLTDEELLKLKALAKEATPGPWIRFGVRMKLGGEDCLRVGRDDFPLAFLPIGREHQHAGAFNDAGFIAAANPSTVTAMVEELLASRKVAEAALAWKTARFECAPYTIRDAVDNLDDSLVALKETKK